MIPEGVASRTQRLRIGDRILKVNGRDVSKATHQDAVQALLEPTAELMLTVQHDPPPKGNRFPSQPSTCVSNPAISNDHVPWTHKMMLMQLEKGTRIETFLVVETNLAVAQQQFSEYVLIV